MEMKLPVYRMLLYTDTLAGIQVSRDDLWVLTTEELNQIEERINQLECQKKALQQVNSELERDIIAIRMRIERVADERDLLSKENYRLRHRKGDL